MKKEACLLEVRCCRAGQWKAETGFLRFPGWAALEVGLGFIAWNIYTLVNLYSLVYLHKFAEVIMMTY